MFIVFLLFFFSDFFLMQLHGEMCRTLSAIYCKVLSIFPSLEAARPRSKSGIQALCSLHIALEKAKNVLQHCSTCSKLYLVRVSFDNTNTQREDMCMHNWIYIPVCILRVVVFTFVDIFTTWFFNVIVVFHHVFSLLENIY